MPLPPSVTFRIFDKQFTNSTHVYDDFLPEAKHNCNSIVKELRADALHVLNEVHGNCVVDVDKNHRFDKQLEADASVTDIPGIVLSVQSADCVPVLLSSHCGRVIGAAHCGWRSAHANILEKVIALMKQKGAEDVHAIIGPAIHQENYQVDQAFYNAITSNENAAHLFIPSNKPDYYQFDLPGFVILKLKKLGVNDIFDYCENTFAHPEKYFSYRYAMQTGDVGEKQNILSTIMIRA